VELTTLAAPVTSPRQLDAEGFKGRGVFDIALLLNTFSLVSDDYRLEE
jgi:hypothetical protein